MTKTYKSTSVLSFSLTLEGGGRTYIKFIPYSYGGSIYSTSNKAIQNAMEKDSLFNRKFVLLSTTGEEEQSKDATPVESEATTLKKVEVTDLDSAKDYLEENFGVDRTTLRRRNNVYASAKEHGVEFVGI